MPVNSVAAGGLTSGGSDVNLGAITNLDVTQFLNLLTTQMRYQDPMNPQTDMEFMTQMASLSQVQELRDLNTQVAYASQAQSVAQASSLIGKAVEGMSFLTGEAVSGIVSEIRSDGITTLLIIGDDAIEIGSVARAYDPLPASELSQSDVARATELIGKSVTGAVAGGGVVHGTVTSMRVDGTRVYLEIETPSAEEGGTPSTSSVDIAYLIAAEGAGSAETLAQCSWLLGYKVTASYPSEENPDATISGVVNGIRLNNGAVLLQVDGKEVGLGNLTKVG